MAISFKAWSRTSETFSTILLAISTILVFRPGFAAMTQVLPSALKCLLLMLQVSFLALLPETATNIFWDVKVASTWDSHCRSMRSNASSMKTRSSCVCLDSEVGRWPWHLPCHLEIVQWPAWKSWALYFWSLIIAYPKFWSKICCLDSWDKLTSKSESNHCDKIHWNILPIHRDLTSRIPGRQQ